MIIDDVILRLNAPLSMEQPKGGAQSEKTVAKDSAFRKRGADLKAEASDYFENALRRYWRIEREDRVCPDNKSCGSVRFRARDLTQEQTRKKSERGRLGFAW